MAQMAQMAHASENPQVIIQTNMGDIVVELSPEKAPITVANFLRYVDDGYYTDTIFHRVISGFMIQGGGFSSKYIRKDTRAPILNEADNGLANQRGSIAMARTNDPNSATSQFFINTVNNTNLNHTSKSPRGWGYTVFGQVVKGMNVVDQIEKLRTGSDGPFSANVPKSPVIIISIKRVPTKESKKESK